MIPQMVVDAGSLIFGITVLVLLASRRRTPWDRNTLFLVVMLATIPLFRDVSNVIEWTFATPMLDTVEDYVELLLPMLWIFVLYALLQQRTQAALTDEVAQRVRAERALLERNAALEEMNKTLHEVIEGTHDLAGCTTLEECGKQALKAFSRATGAQGGVLYLKQEDALVLLGSLDPGHAPETLPLPLDPRSVLGLAWENQEPLLVENVATTPGIVPSGWQGYRDGSVLAMQLRGENGTPLGVVALHNRHQPPFSDRDRGAAEILLSVCSETVRAVAALNALRTSERRFRTMLDFTYDWEYWVDPAGAFVYVSPSCERVTGYAREEFMNDPSLLTRIVHPEDASVVREHADLETESEPLGGVDFRIVRACGDVRWLNHVCRPVFDGEGRYAGRRASNRDVTQERALEDQLRQAQKMEALGQLAGGVAHDFNNILQAINGYIELSHEDLPEGHPARPCLAEASRAAERAATLVRQLLTLSRKEAMVPRRVDPVREIADVLSMLRRLIGENVELDVRPGKDVSAIYADAAQVEQILINLCVNARDAMPTGGKIIIELENTTFDAAYVENHPWAKLGDYVLLAVSDTGEGIAPEVVPHIFEPFYTTKEVGQGTGLGLATVYGIVNQHKGFIHVYSEPGRGTTFRVYLPQIDREASDTEEDAVAAKPRGGDETILLAEDDELVRGLAVRVLQQAGYQVIVANDGEEAVHKYEENRDRIDLCLLDVVMPRLGGKEVHDRVKAIRPALPVLFSSGYSFGALGAHSLPSKDTDFIAKPYNPNDLLRRIRAMLDRPSKDIEATPTDD